MSESPMAYLPAKAGLTVWSKFALSPVRAGAAGWFEPKPASGERTRLSFSSGEWNLLPEREK